MQENFSHNDIKRCLRIPHLGKELAEELGIHVGDGCLGTYKYDNGIKYLYIVSGGYCDESYFKEFVIPLIYNLYNLYPYFYKSKKEKSIYIRYQSKGLLNFKNSLGLPLGKKTNITIPKIILNSRFDLDFLRGMFDTDGCLTFAKRNRNVYYYPRLDITSQSSKLIAEISKILGRKKFTFSTLFDEVKIRYGVLSKTSRIFLYGEENLFRWMELIGSSNPKNTIKFNFWKKHKYLPKNYHKASGGI